MRPLTRWLALVVAVSMVAALGLSGCGGGGGGTAYSVADLRTGAPVSVADLRGQPALLVSWATWCRECDEELAGLQAFAESDAAEGLRIVAVNLDAAKVEDEIDAKIAKHGLTVDLWRDRRNEFKRAFGALGVPTTVLLDAEGKVVGTFPGAIDFEDEKVLAAIDKVRS
ncbi:MAG: TlpA family protein disulfide reductase [Microthrixaceae bacterium]|nr:TlpA family protein disulfide reductase [Acidimicrobiales bacterium]MCB9403976.1 TlpA family protein disulfide reductase [Microthrixaceae bacterium]